MCDATLKCQCNIVQMPKRVARTLGGTNIGEHSAKIRDPAVAARRRDLEGLWLRGLARILLNREGEISSGKNPCFDAHSKARVSVD